MVLLSVSKLDPLNLRGGGGKVCDFFCFQKKKKPTPPRLSGTVMQVEKLPVVDV